MGNKEERRLCGLSVLNYFCVHLFIMSLKKQLLILYSLQCKHFSKTTLKLLKEKESIEEDERREQPTYTNVKAALLLLGYASHARVSLFSVSYPRKIEHYFTKIGRGVVVPELIAPTIPVSGLCLSLSLPTEKYSSMYGICLLLLIFLRFFFSSSSFSFLSRFTEGK
eukprot:gene8062-5614_t